MAAKRTKSMKYYIIFLLIIFTTIVSGFGFFSDKKKDFVGKKPLLGHVDGEGTPLPKDHFWRKGFLTGRALRTTTSNSFILAKDYGIGFPRSHVVLKGIESSPPLNNPGQFRRSKALLHRATSNRLVFCKIEEVIHVAPPNTVANQSPFLGQVLATCYVGCDDVRPSPGLKWKLPAPVCLPGENRLDLGKWLARKLKDT